MIQGLRHTGIVVADLDGALKFWRDVMGFRVVRQMDESGLFIDRLLGLEDVRVTTSKLAGPDDMLVELLHFHSHGDEPRWRGTPFSTGLTHLAFTVTDLDRLAVELIEAGATFIAPPQLSPDGLVKVAYVSGPEGLLLELVEEIVGE